MCYYFANITFILGADIYRIKTRGAIKANKAILFESSMKATI